VDVGQRPDIAVRLAAPRAAALLAVLVCATTCATVVLGQTLNDTLVSAYHFSPIIQAERARLRAIDENVPQARAGFLPSVSASGDARITNTRTGTRNGQGTSTTVSTLSGTATNGSGESRGTLYGVTVRQPIFRGFRTINAVNRAEALVRAGREQLRSTEQTVLLAAITAHADVMATLRQAQLAERSQKLLTTMLDLVERRLKDQDVSKIDVEQTRSRRAGAVASLQAAQAAYKAARARYEEVVGIDPGNLRGAKLATALLPPTLTAAVESALAENPVIAAAYFRESAAEFDVRTIRGELLPELSINGAYSGEDVSGVGAGQARTAEVLGRLTVPIFEGGVINSRIRQAKEIQYSFQREVEQARNQARQQVQSAWALFKSNDQQVAARKIQLDSALKALKGIRELEGLGQRIIGNVLDAQQDVVVAETTLVNAERDRLIAGYAVAAAIGRLTMETLSVVDTSEIYAPQAHADAVRNELWSTTVTDADGKPLGAKH
jgi:outer membrane protein